MSPVRNQPSAVEGAAVGPRRLPVVALHHVPRADLNSPGTPAAARRRWCRDRRRAARSPGPAPTSRSACSRSASRSKTGHVGADLGDAVGREVPERRQRPRARRRRASRSPCRRRRCRCAGSRGCAAAPPARRPGAFMWVSKPWMRVAPLALDQVERRVGIEVSVSDLAMAPDQRSERPVDIAEDVEQRQVVDDDVALGDGRAAARPRACCGAANGRASRPWGSPVVPEVYMMKTVSVGLTAAAARGAPPRPRAAPPSSSVGPATAPGGADRS